MKISKIFIPLFSSLLVIVPAQISNSCAWGYDEDQNFLSPFNSEIPEIPEYYPFFYSSHYFNGDPNTDWSENTKEDAYEIFDPEYANVQEWTAYFNNKILNYQIDELIYQSGTEDFKQFAEYINGRTNTVSASWKQNGLLQYWKTNKNDPSFTYLYFAKNMEPLVQGSDYWEPVKRDTKQLLASGTEAMKQMNSTDDAFIKLRWAYQAMRCAHYAGKYDECIKIYDKYVAPLQNESLIKYWCLSLKAGAYWRQNKFAESSYYNSLVFDNCLTRRLYSERDFWIDNEPTWQKCLAMCKNDHEKSVLWFLTGINQNNSAIPALYAMLKTDPASREVELLLAREMEKIQRNYMPARWSDDFDAKEEDFMRPESNDLNEIYIFITKGLETNKVHTPAFWECAAAFIQYINKEYPSCERHCGLAVKAANGNTELIKQAKILKTVNEVEAAGKIDAEIEKKIMQDVQWLFENKDPEQEYADTYSQDAYRICMYRLMQYYKAAGKPVQMEMCRANAVEFYDIYEAPEKAPVDAIYNYFTDTKRTAFESFLAKQYPYTADDMLEIKGTLKMRQYQWKDAIALFSKMTNPVHEKMQLPTDPFLIHIYDCHDCDFQEYPGTYTKLSFCEKMVQLENLLNAKDVNPAQTYHQLANAYYNISYFGNSWMAIDYYRCHGCEDVDRTAMEDNFSWYYADFFDVSKATQYYKLAIENTKDKEFQALNYFMLAKCEQDNYYVSEDYSYENEKGLKKNYRSNFNTLKTDYKTTKFYKEAIEECKYFDYYVNLH